MKIKKFLSAILAALLLQTLCACGAKIEPNRVFSASDMQGKTVGVLASAPASGYMTPFSEKMNIKYYSNVAGMTEDLISGALDCAVADSATAESMKKAQAHLTVLPEPLINRDYRIAVSQENTVLRDNINSALAEMAADGSLSEIVDGWLAGKYELPEHDYTPEGTLLAAIDPTFPPYCFSGENGEYLGIEADVLRAVCRRLNLELQFVRSDADNIVYFVESGKVALAWLLSLPFCFVTAAALRFSVKGPTKKLLKEPVTEGLRKDTD